MKLLQSSGKFNAAEFRREYHLFNRARLKKALDAKIRRCQICPGMNITCRTEAAPGFGDLQAKVFFVGQSLCTQCMATGIPFTEQSGYYIDAVLRLSNLQRKDVFMTNVIHCHPPKNRASSKVENYNCARYLRQELEIVKPQLVVALGADAKRILQKMHSAMMPSTKLLAVKHPASFLYNGYKDVDKWIINLSMEIDNVK